MDGLGGENGIPGCKEDATGLTHDEVLDRTARYMQQLTGGTRSVIADSRVKVII